MSRRSSGEGSISQRKDGRWQGAIQIGGKRGVVYGKSRSEVAAKLRGLADGARSAGQIPSSGNLTLAAYLQTWLEQAESRLRPTTLADYRVIANRHLIPQIGHTRLSRLSALQVGQHERILCQTLSKRRVRMVHDLLHKALGDATRWGLVATNVSANVDPPKRVQVEFRLWDPAQASSFVNAMLDGQAGYYSPLFAFLLASGCRIGEAVGLRCSDVNMQARTVRIERQLVEIAGRFVEGEPKSRSGVRSVSLPEFGLKALSAMKARVAECRLQQGIGWIDSGHVFVTERGTPPSRSNLRRAFNATCLRLNLPAIRLHDLRHLSLSLLAMNGVPVKVAQVRAGHSNPQLTLRVYQHVLGDADRQAAEILERAMTQLG